MLTGMHGVLRIRVAGDYRVLYTVDDDRLVVWSWTPAIAGRSTVSVLAGWSETIRGLDDQLTRHAGRTVVGFVKDLSIR
jgi:hypothetical protein